MHTCVIYVYIYIYMYTCGPDILESAALLRAVCRRTSQLQLLAVASFLQTTHGKSSQLCLYAPCAAVTQTYQTRKCVNTYKSPQASH